MFAPQSPGRHELQKLCRARPPANSNKSGAGAVLQPAARTDPSAPPNSWPQPNSGSLRSSEGLLWVSSTIIYGIKALRVGHSFNPPQRHLQQLPAALVLCSCSLQRRHPFKRSAAVASSRPGRGTAPRDVTAAAVGTRKPRCQTQAPRRDGMRTPSPTDAVAVRRGRARPQAWAGALKVRRARSSLR